MGIRQIEWRFRQSGFGTANGIRLRIMDGMTKIAKSAIETFAIEMFEWPGYDYIYALSTAADSDNLLLNTISGEVRVHL